MNKATKLFLLLVIAYTFLGKVYTSFFYFVHKVVNGENTLLIHIPNIVILFSCVYLFLFTLNKVSRAQNKFVRFFCHMLVVYAILCQALFGIMEFFNKNPNINSNKLLYLGDIPNMLSIIVLIFCIVTLIQDKEPCK